MIAPLPRPSQPGLLRRALPGALLAAVLALGGLAAGGSGRASAAPSYGNPTISIGSASTISVTTSFLGGAYNITSPTVVPGGAVAVSGNGFDPGEMINLTLSGQSSPFATVQADGNGNVSGTVTIPSATTPGTYLVTAAGVQSGHTATVSLTVSGLVPELGLASGTLNAGGTLVVSGAGFGPNEPITFTFNGAAVAATSPITTDATGAFAGASITIPAATATSAACGCTYSFTATGSATGVTSNASVTVNSLTLSVTSLTAGTVTISGGGFTPGELVNITLAGQTGVLATLQADSSGNVNAIIPLPANLASGSYALIAIGLSSGNTATTGFVPVAVDAAVPAAAPTISLGSVAVAGGGALSISGSGFAANEMVALTLNGPLGSCTPQLTSGSTVVTYTNGCEQQPTGPLGGGYSPQVLSLGTVQADASGQVNTSVAISASLAPGLYTVSAMGTASGATASISVIVNSAVPLQNITLGW